MFYPVVTLVLYFGYTKEWKVPQNLLGCLSVAEELKPYVSDYHTNIFQIAYLEESDLELFHSDFRIVADYFIQMRKNNNWVPGKEVIYHVHEVMQLMSVLSGDDRFEAVYDSSLVEGETTMCEVLDRVENRGIEKGKTEGIAVGKAEAIRSMIEAMREFGIPDDSICGKIEEKFGISGEEAKKLFPGK